MRLPERDRRNAWLRRRGEAALDAYGEPLSQWGPPVLIRPMVQPASSVLDMRVYGERVMQMLRLYCDGDVDIREGDGLCIEAPGDQPPDYRVVSVARWDHLEMDVERIAGAPEKALPFWGEETPQSERLPDPSEGEGTGAAGAATMDVERV